MKPILQLAATLLLALALMAAMGAAAFVLARTNPAYSSGWFFGAAGILYTPVLLLILSRLGPR